MEQIMKVHDATTIRAPTPSQFAALTALDGDQSCVAAMRSELVKRKELCCARLDRLSSSFSYVPPKGACLFPGNGHPNPARGHRVIPGGCFGPGVEHHMRLSFGGEPREIDEAFDRLEAWLAKKPVS